MSPATGHDLVTATSPDRGRPRSGHDAQVHAAHRASARPAAWPPPDETAGHGRRRHGSDPQRGDRGAHRPGRSLRPRGGRGPRGAPAGPRHRPAGAPGPPRRHRGVRGPRLHRVRRRACHVRRAPGAGRRPRTPLRRSRPPAGRPRGDLPAQLPGVGAAVLGRLGLRPRRRPAQRLVAGGRARARGGRRRAAARRRRRRAGAGPARGDSGRRPGGGGPRPVGGLRGLRGVPRGGDRRRPG